MSSVLKVSAGALMDSTLSERLCRLAGRQTLKLTHYGRKSGKPFQVTIWFVVAGDKIYLSTAKIHRNWVRNVQKTARVRLAIGGESFDGEARFLSEPADRERVLSLFKKKYWPFILFMALNRLLVRLGLAKDTFGSFEVALSS